MVWAVWQKGYARMVQKSKQIIENSIIFENNGGQGVKCFLNLFTREFVLLLWGCVDLKN